MHDGASGSTPEAVARVIQVVTQREPAGAQRIAHQLCRRFRSHGIEGNVIFLYRRADAFDEERYLDLRQDPPGPVSTVVLVWRLARILRSERPTAVIGHTFHANVVSAVAGVLARVRQRVAVHHVLGDFESRSRRAVMWLLHRTSIVTTHVYVSRTTLESFNGVSARRSVVIYNGVGDVAADQSGGAASIRRWVRDPRPDGTERLVVSVGRLAPQKDHRVLLQASAALPGVRIAIIGEGELRDALRAQAAALEVSDRVTLVGNIPPEEVADALQAADVVVQPSVWETFGMVVLEAMRAGRAMVVSDVPAHREIAGPAARYHAVGDAGSLALAVNDLLNDRSARERLGAAALTRAQRFSENAMVEGYLRVLGLQATPDPRGRTPSMPSR